jgi:hypothetical protein
MLVPPMRKILFALMLLSTGAFAEDLTEKYAALGQLIITPFETAPFPHPLRAKGHYYGTNFLSAAEHYSDNRVALFVPKDFKPGRKTDFVVHFHGWGNSIERAFHTYDLAEQFTASKRNAILIVPQGPYHSQDSFDGKLEDLDGFKRFMAEAVATLKQRGVIKSDKIGTIILSGHSGGYEVISSIVAWGGMGDNIREVWLFDALYGNTERFVVWFDHHKGRFLDIYTDHGGTKDETEHLVATLEGNKIPLYKGEESSVTPQDLKNHLVFIHTGLIHDEVMQQTHNFRRFLETSALDEIRH